MKILTSDPTTTGVLDPHSVYEVIRLASGKPQFLPEHYDRIRNSLKSIGRTVPFSYDELAESIEELASKGHISDHNVRREGDLSDRTTLFPGPTSYPTEDQYRTGVRVGLFKGERRNPHLKMLDYELRSATDDAISQQDLHEVLLVDRYGNITEGSRSNVFFIKKGEVYTPPLHQVLPGITRGKIIETVLGKGKPFHEEPIPADEIDSFDAAFICGTSPKVLPIASIGNVLYDVDDPLLRDIMEWYEDILRSDRGNP